MNWKEFKEEWKKLEPARKSEIYSYLTAMLCTMIVIIIGLKMFTECVKQLPDDYKQAINGVFMFAAGTFLFTYFYTRWMSNRISRLADRIEMLEGKDEE